MIMSLKHLNILLADDDMDDCLFFQAALDGLSLSTNLTTVHDGEQLMHYLTNGVKVDNVEPELPDLLFLDINMPRKNGKECLAEIKLNNKLKQLPVIMFSTSYEKEVVNLLYNDGAQYFIRKPSEFSQFKKIIQQTLTLITHETIFQRNRENFVLSVENIGNLKNQ